MVLPQGWMQEYREHTSREAWTNSVAIAQASEHMGFESVWMYDHFHTWPAPEDVIVFEPFVALSALASATERVRIGHIVICTGFRNPALTAKMISTLDVVSDGRAELGIGAGWKQEEWEAWKGSARARTTCCACSPTASPTARSPRRWSSAHARWRRT